ncbi:3-ketoacyl-ACP reductase [Piscinibacter sp. HJYY11]|uniref:3-ketoacyl-ACP reductase n=1 Tax=Piscinibacter sp. HJYY11 TaxID=2801333 RepID=UPI00191DD97E|nr:3-ketoacyl-ACP reductase [Piscinibacter sp. HJYY11]MBL0729624.1 3-ketoacyl-ACP reductase [Piscinibacter sp. HJYY11]
MTQSRPLALVTGARRGIGARIAVELARLGYDLALTDVAAEGAQEVIEEVKSLGGEAHLFTSDLAEVESRVALIESVVQWRGPIATLVNNAGIGSPRRGDLLDVTPDGWDRVLDVNLRGTFFLSQAVAQHMLASDCKHVRSIVTVSSVSAEMASIERSEYCVSKAGLGMVTKLLSLRLAPHGIGVFEIRPGVIRTPLTEAVATRYDQRIADGLVPMGRWGEADDVARAVGMLVAGDMAFATGSVVNVDGALSVPRF